MIPLRGKIRPMPCLKSRSAPGPGPENSLCAVPLEDGLAVEAVYYGSGTLCLSTQVGCAMGCPFCASGRKGLVRNLTPSELWAQVDHARGKGLAPRRITLSGIGEPLQNAAAVEPFLLEASRAGLPVSVTTTGRPLGRLQRFLTLPHNGLMLSLHAGRGATHRRLIPKGPDFSDLWRLLTETLPTLSRRQRRRLGVNVLLLSGINDGDDEIAALAQRLRPFPDLTVHLLTLNPTDAGPTMASPGPEGFDRVHRRLSEAGLNVRRANRWRRQAKGGCGTLVVRTWPSPS